MRVLIEQSYEALSRKAAQIVQEQITAKPDSVLGLATGSTPLGLYAELIRLFKVGEIDFSKVVSYNLDEYFPIKKSNEQSYDFFMRKNFFDHVNISKKFIPDGEASNYSAECAAYEKKIADSEIDLQILGIGNNGHIGFNEPSNFFEEKTHYVQLDESTIQANARFFAHESDVPRHAITMGIGTIMRAKKILLLASGATKAEIIHELLNGKISPKNPSSVLKLHRDVTVIIDRDASLPFLFEERF
ncbi:MAG: glucosamine-6-phosphate deaminase [Defluviitaleaceae bacterium]|nr:glucosamine-6-phosphate deaminase [Defluviitaleaceae bacterium]